MALLALAALAGWIAWTRASAGGDRPLAWRDLTGAFGTVQFARPYSHAFGDRKSLVRALHDARPDGGGPVPAIDFSRDEAFVVAAGPRSSSGYDLKVLSVSEKGDRVLVRVRERTPTLRERVTAGLTFPHRLIAFPRTGKPVRVHWEGRP